MLTWHGTASLSCCKHDSNGIRLIDLPFGSCGLNHPHELLRILLDGLRQLGALLCHYRQNLLQHGWVLCYHSSELREVWIVPQLCKGTHCIFVRGTSTSAASTCGAAQSRKGCRASASCCSWGCCWCGRGCWSGICIASCWSGCRWCSATRSIGHQVFWDASHQVLDSSIWVVEGSLQASFYFRSWKAHVHQLLDGALHGGAANHSCLSSFHGGRCISFHRNWRWSCGNCWGSCCRAAATGGLPACWGGGLWLGGHNYQEIAFFDILILHNHVISQDFATKYQLLLLHRELRLHRCYLLLQLSYGIFGLCLDLNAVSFQRPCCDLHAALPAQSLQTRSSYVLQQGVLRPN
mmetsp:Transcript_63753/g.151986  ORF Transcript_63753/g.151986 Transcript_63753/m.151986 type:complete len:350 (-) Transcript_63753:44-1093(-)